MKVIVPSGVVSNGTNRTMVCEQDVDSFADALRVSATHIYLERRREIFDNIKCKGALAVDVVPEKLPVAMVNSYLEIKSRGLL